MKFCFLPIAIATGLASTVAAQDYQIETSAFDNIFSGSGGYGFVMCNGNMPTHVKGSDGSFNTLPITNIVPMNIGGETVNFSRFSVPDAGHMAIGVVNGQFFAVQQTGQNQYSPVETKTTSSGDFCPS